jgi:hypothetical protein
LFLVTIQAIIITYDINQNTKVTYLNNFITKNGHFLASFFVLYYLIIVIYLDFFSSEKIEHEQANISKSTIKFNIYYNVLNWVFFFIIVYLVIKLVGFSNIIEDSRPGAPGNTFLLILLSICNYPLYFKVSKKSKIKLNELLLFTLTIIFTFFFSRLIASFHLLILFFLIINSILKYEYIKILKFKFRFIVSLFIFFILFITIGIIRDLQNFAILKSMKFTDSTIYLFNHKELLLEVVNRIYKVGIEGVSGLSGALTQFLDTYTIKLDFGISAIGGFFNLIPSFFRSYLGDIIGIITSFYWYNGSIVGSGLEATFVHFSFIGLIFYPFFIVYYLNRNINNLSSSTSNNNQFSGIKYAIFLVYGLLLIRGSSFAFVFFLSSNYIIYNIALFFLTISNDFIISES